MVRQVLTHVEFENEWQSAIHVQVRLGPVVHAMIKWCGTDQVVFVKAFRSVAAK
jgi:hypothetical protein